MAASSSLEAQAAGRSTRKYTACWTEWRATTKICRSHSGLRTFPRAVSGISGCRYLALLTNWLSSQRNLYFIPLISLMKRIGVLAHFLPAVRSGRGDTAASSSRSSGMSSASAAALRRASKAPKSPSSSIVSISILPKNSPVRFSKRRFTPLRRQRFHLFCMLLYHFTTDLRIRMKPTIQVIYFIRR